MIIHVERQRALDGGQFNTEEEAVAFCLAHQCDPGVRYIGLRVYDAQEYLVSPPVAISPAPGALEVPTRAGPDQFRGYARFFFCDDWPEPPSEGPDTEEEKTQQDGQQVSDRAGKVAQQAQDDISRSCPYGEQSLVGWRQSDGYSRNLDGSIHIYPPGFDQMIGYWDFILDGYTLLIAPWCLPSAPVSPAPLLQPYPRTKAGNDAWQQFLRAYIANLQKILDRLALLRTKANLPEPEDVVYNAALSVVVSTLSLIQDWANLLGPNNNLAQLLKTYEDGLTLVLNLTGVGEAARAALNLMEAVQSLVAAVNDLINHP